MELLILAIVVITSFMAVYNYDKDKPWEFWAYLSLLNAAALGV